MKLLLYCTKSKPYLEYKQIPRTLMEIDNSFEGYRCSYERTEDCEEFQLNGKIVAECDFEVEEITIGRSYGFNPNMCIISTKNLQPIELLSKSCFEDYDDLFKYLKYDFDNDYGQHKKPYGYAIYIRNLHIFDKPRGLSEYYKIDNTRTLREAINRTKPAYIPINKAPQSMMYCFEDDGNHLQQNILISIRPEWLCKILNGEKTIEVRKKVLKEMLNNE